MYFMNEPIGPETFKRQLAIYKDAIDTNIVRYATTVRANTMERYGQYPALVTNTYLDLLERGGKRIRGSLAIVGYEMCGGADRKMIVQAATALEMIHAYLLIIDDIQDCSRLRRNKATVHEILAKHAKVHKLRGDADHAGMALGLNAALLGAHTAQALLADLNVSAELRVKVINVVNDTMITTSHGQTVDIMNAIVSNASFPDVEHALEWKTAHYTVLNPLRVGMILAGAGEEDIGGVWDYALCTGRAFQIVDDIVGTFRDDEQNGKDVMDDIREGKRTVLTYYALQHTTPVERDFLRDSLGNGDLTKTDFERCRQIIKSSGALSYAKRLVRDNAGLALASLAKHSKRWQGEKVSFLEGLIQYLVSKVYAAKIVSDSLKE